MEPARRHSSAAAEPIHNVGIGEYRAARSGTLVTHALGSCVAVCIFDVHSEVAGLLHILLPTSREHHRRNKRPGLFADTGVPALLRRIYAHGGRHLRAKIAGGANMLGPKSNLQIGERNVHAVREAIWRARIAIDAEDVGSTRARTAWFDVSTRKLTITSVGTKHIVL